MTSEPPVALSGPVDGRRVLPQEPDTTSGSGRHVKGGGRGNETRDQISNSFLKSASEVSRRQKAGRPNWSDYSGGRNVPPDPTPPESGPGLGGTTELPSRESGREVLDTERPKVLYVLPLILPVGGKGPRRPGKCLSRLTTEALVKDARRRPRPDTPRGREDVKCRAPPLCATGTLCVSSLYQGHYPGAHPGLTSDGRHRPLRSHTDTKALGQ